jgi:hypothetical protein
MNINPCIYGKVFEKEMETILIIICCLSHTTKSLERIDSGCAGLRDPRIRPKQSLSLFRASAVIFFEGDKNSTKKANQNVDPARQVRSTHTRNILLVYIMHRLIVMKKKKKKSFLFFF